MGRQVCISFAARFSALSKTIFDSLIKLKLTLLNVGKRTAKLVHTWRPILFDKNAEINCKPLSHDFIANQRI